MNERDKCGYCEGKLKKSIAYIAMAGVLLCTICVVIAIGVEKKHKAEFVEVFLQSEINSFSSAAWSLSSDGDIETEMDKNEFSNLFVSLGECSSYSNSIQYLEEEHRFMHTMINDYIWEFTYLFYDQGIYRWHTKEYYQDVISDFLIISDWLYKKSVDASFDKITSYDFHMEVEPKLSQSFAEYMDF